MQMVDGRSSPDTDDATGVGPDPVSTTGTPRWVKVFGIVALVVVVLVAVVLLIGGEHGRGRHTGGGADAAAAHTGPPPGFDHREQSP